MARGTMLVCTGASTAPGLPERLAGAGLDTCAMELLPRITRAQSMDVLSSQANLAGYRAVIEAAAAFDRGFPMMMTAAGTVPPARVLVVGAGVAGLQAIATARRLGAIVSATDVRPAARDEIRSLGATFVGVEDEETAKQTGAYASEMSDAFRRKQAELLATAAARSDLVICTALVQGRKAPVIVGADMVASMKPGSVVVDIASDAGGNCAATVPGQSVTTANGVKVLGWYNWPARIPVAASSLYARNLLTFLTAFWDKDASRPNLPEGDEIAKGVLLTRGGAVVHPRYQDPPRGESMNPTTYADEAARIAARASELSSALRAAGVTTLSTVEPVAAAVQPFAYLLAVFLMACFVGYYVVWNVTPALHSPLMGVTNAISSVIIVGAMLATGLSVGFWPKLFGFLGVTLASVNIFGGFAVTQRMLAMFQSRNAPEPAGMTSATQRLLARFRASPAPAGRQ